MTLAGVVAALDREARTLGPVAEHRTGYGILADGTLRAVSGVGCAAADAAARCLLEAGAQALISWGVAGGLDPRLGAGTVCLPREILAPDGACLATATAWRDHLASSAGRPVCAGLLITRLQPVTSAAAKAALHVATGAVAVDMESSAVAQVAAAARVPFVAVRVIVDTARDAIPDWLVAAAEESGRVRMGSVLAGLLRSPRDTARLVRLARHFGAAARSLRAVAAAGRLTPPAAGVPPRVDRGAAGSLEGRA